MARKKKEQHFDLYPAILWLLPIFLIALKFSLMRSYHSTDFDVHRNWMAITFNLPIDQWYYSNISQWTLDYPPLFAYFEWVLSQLAAQIDPSILALKSEPYFSQNVLIFQRLSVIGGDIFIGCALITNNFINWVKGRNYRNRLKIGIYSFLISTPALILLDNIHFQYNGFLYGIFLLSLNAIFTGKIIQGAFLFAILLNFKHIFLYYALSFVAFYFSTYLLPFNAKFINRCAKLFFVLFFVLSISFGPFLLQGGIPMLKQIISRLFPFKRGLTHANWAPNFWVLYNLMDFSTTKLAIKMAKNCTKFPWNSILKECPLKSPEYTRGLVQEYSHSFLPNITPSIAFALVLSFLTPALWIFTKKEFNRNDQFLISLTFSAYSFFLFGWHVHEKATLMIFFPMAILSIKNLQFIEPFSLISISSTISQFPLFFTPLENVVKFSLLLANFSLSIFLVNFCWRLNSGELIQTSFGKFLLKMMFTAEIYALIFHPLFFGSNQFQFLPIILSSFSRASTILYSYFYFILAIFGQQICIQIAKNQIIKKERRILQNEFHQKFDPTNIRHIAGIDLSQCQQNNSPLAVVTLTILEFPSMKLVYCADEFILLTTFGGHIPPYIPEFLALREALPLERVIRRHIQKCPKIDILFVDSNGKWHSRGCGLACHVGFDTEICTIGVAKTFNGFPLISNGNFDQKIKIQQKCEQSADEAALFEFIWPNDEKQFPNQLAVIRTKTSKNPFFISTGFGLNFVEAMEISFNCFAKNSSTANPIRMSDLRSRKLVEEIFEN